MDAAAELGRNPVSKHQIQPEYGDEQADAGRGCRTRLARPNSQARTRTGKCFPCSVDHAQDWQPQPVDKYSGYMCDHTYMHSLEQKEHYKHYIIVIGEEKYIYVFTTGVSYCPL
ncbi:unnamed protein product [Ascophyllum nodosum]